MWRPGAVQMSNLGALGWHQVEGKADTHAFLRIQTSWGARGREGRLVEERWKKDKEEEEPAMKVPEQSVQIHKAGQCRLEAVQS